MVETNLESVNIDVPKRGATNIKVAQLESTELRPIEANLAAPAGAIEMNSVMP